MCGAVPRRRVDPAPSVALVLISTLPWVEAWFDGIDRAAIWHRRVAIAGLVRLAPHLVLSSSPDGTTLGGPLGAAGAIGSWLRGLGDSSPLAVIAPARAWPRALAADGPLLRDVRWLFGGYERWRMLHRMTGLFVAAGFVHGLLDATAFSDSGVLRWSYVAIGGIGLAFYVYRELLARHFRPFHDYQVAAMREIDEGFTEIAIARSASRSSSCPASSRWSTSRRTTAGTGIHSRSRAPPARATSASPSRCSATTRRASGELVEPGMPAVIGGPHGRFSHGKGTSRQVWVAGGVGVAPFLSWLRALDGDLKHRVDFFYTSDGEPPFAEEIRRIADDHDSLHAHLIDTSVSGRLTVEQVLATAGDPHGLSVFMCGPTGMVRTFQAELRAAGVPSRRIHREYFDWR